MHCPLGCVAFQNQSIPFALLTVQKWRGERWRRVSQFWIPCCSWQFPPVISNFKDCSQFKLFSPVIQAVLSSASFLKSKLLTLLYVQRTGVRFCSYSKTFWWSSSKKSWLAKIYFPVYRFPPAHIWNNAAERTSLLLCQYQSVSNYT